MLRSPWTVVATALMAVTANASAQDAATPDVEFNGAVPASPAFLFLDGTPEQVARPSTARDLGFALLNGLDQNGNLAQGFALEASPWIYFDGLSISLADYQRSWLKRALANLQISVGTDRSGGSAATTDLAFGLRIPLYDGGDPMADPVLVRELGQALLDCLPESPDANESEIQACTDAAVSERFASYTAEHWNSPRLSLAVASGARIDRGGGAAASAGNLTDYRGTKAWLSGGIPVLASTGVLLAQATFVDQPEFEPGSEMRSVSFGGRLAVGTPSRNFFVEAVGEVTWPSGAERDSSGRWSTGFELRLSEDLWVSTGLGRTFNRLAEPDRTVVLANVRWAVTSSARMGQLIRGARAAAQ